MNFELGKNINNVPIFSIYNGKYGKGIMFNEMGRFFTFTVDFAKIPKYYLNTFAIGFGHKQFTLFWFQYVGGDNKRFILEFFNSGEKVISF